MREIASFRLSEVIKLIRALVVYHSLYGNTEKAGRALAEGLDREGN
jgi:flavorubredoxin